MIDRSFIGLERPPITVDVERGRLRSFAKAIGETNPVYSDADAARHAGYRDIPAPPTYAFCLEMLDAADPFVLIRQMGIPLERLLHGEQSFTYHGTICAGDRVVLATRVSDIYEKKGGALEFVVQDTAVTNQHGELVAEMRQVAVVRN
jgi:acyl dehydratase